MPPRKKLAARRRITHDVMAGVHRTQRHRRREMGHMKSQLYHGKQAIGARLFAEQAESYGAQRAASIAEEAVGFHRGAAKQSGVKARQSGHRARKLSGALSDKVTEDNPERTPRGGSSARRRKLMRELMGD